MSKEKECFIIMPISDNPNYEKGHFLRVYNHLIKPACKIAGFKPIRADDVINTNYIALDIIKKIINSDMAICDLSSSNPNVLYELGIRQAFNKPVTLIKDDISKRIFDIQGFRDFEYDKNLRIDNVEKEIIELAEIIKSTNAKDGKDINSLVSLLGMKAAKVDSQTEISNDTKLILNSISNLDKRVSEIEKEDPNNLLIQKWRDARNKKSNKIISDFYTINLAKDIPENVGDPLSKSEIKKLKIGDNVFHPKYGMGEVISINHSENKRTLAQILFENNSVKYILADLGDLRKVL